MDPRIDTRHYPVDEVVDVTAELGEENPVNSLYRLPSGQIVKVKAWSVHHASLLENQRMHVLSAVFCDEKGQRAPGAQTRLWKHLSRISPDHKSHAVQVEDGRRWLALHHEVMVRQADPVERAAPAPDHVLQALGGDGWVPADHTGAPLLG